MDCKVYVGDLGYGAAKQELEDAFSKYGPLRNVWVARNPPGFAFVEFEDPRDAEDSVRALDGTRMNGRRVRVELSTGRSRRGGRRQMPGGDRGGSRYGGASGGGGGGGYGGGSGGDRGSRDRYSRKRSRSYSPRARGGRSYSRSRSRSRSPSRDRRRSVSPERRTSLDRFGRNIRGRSASKSRSRSPAWKSSAKSRSRSRSRSRSGERVNGD